ncbi:amidohydrolase [Myxococcota bacterium]|nr:amidohydrolase [Myxococcota bacterium]
MSESHRLVSADSHICEVEACYEQIDPKYRSERPQAANDGDIGAYMEIPNIDLKVPMGSLCRAGVPPEKWNRPVPWEELHPAGYDPKARLAIQDEEGVLAEVLYPSVGMVVCNHTDWDYKKACFDAYNRWLAEFCSTDPRRLIGIGMAAVRTIEEGIEEVEQIKAMGFQGVMLCGDPLVEDYHHPSYDPFWQACIDHGLPVNFHILTTRGDMGGAARGPAIINQIMTIRGNQNIITMMILGAVFERNPELRVIMVENDAGWIPHFGFRMDHAWERHRWWMETGAIQRKPSEYLKENVYATFQDDYSVKLVLDGLNLERVMWASDFPHGDGTYPESQEIATEMTNTMTSSQRQAILHDNAASLYQL